MIEITPQIAALLSILSPDDQSICLNRAWAACCDAMAFPDCDYDPWDGKHENERRSFEYQFLAQVISDL